MGKKMGVNVTSRNLNADGLIKIDSANSLRRFNGANSWPTVSPSPPPSMERNLASDIKKFGKMADRIDEESLQYVLLGARFRG